MSNHYKTITATLIILALPVGCADAESTPTSVMPTNTPVPPTVTPLPPTSTPTATSISPTNTSTPIPTQTSVSTNIPTVASEPEKSFFEHSTADDFKTAATGEDCILAGLPESACTGVSTNAEWTPVIREFDGISMTLVPAGCFMMGNADGFPEEQPVHEICFDQPFWIDLTEVTVAQFAQFLNGQNEPVLTYEGWISSIEEFTVPVQLTLQDDRWTPARKQDNYPLESVTWMGADAYCAWRAARLPTEAEWEYAARGPDSLLYPWGNELISDNVVYSGKRVPEVGSKPQGASWVGALDMSGSLFEWTNSIFRPYPYNAYDGREVNLQEDNASHRVYRGSSWYHSDDITFDNVSATARHDTSPDYAAYWDFGFRCARSFYPTEPRP